MFQINLGQHIAGEFELCGAHIRQAIDDCHRANGHRYVQNRAICRLGGRNLCIRHDTVTGAEVDSAVGDLSDSAAGTDGIVVDLDTGKFIIGIKPFGV